MHRSRRSRNQRHYKLFTISWQKPKKHWFLTTKTPLKRCRFIRFISIARHISKTNWIRKIYPSKSLWLSGKFRSHSHSTTYKRNLYLKHPEYPEQQLDKLAAGKLFIRWFGIFAFQYMPARSTFCDWRGLQELRGKVIFVRCWKSAVYKLPKKHIFQWKESLLRKRKPWFRLLRRSIRKHWWSLFVPTRKTLLEWRAMYWMFRT